VGSGNHVLDGDPILRGEGAFHCKVLGHSAVICAKTAEPIEMPFGLWAQGIVFGSIGAVATNFWTQFAITGFV